MARKKRRKRSQPSKPKPQREPAPVGAPTSASTPGLRRKRVVIMDLPYGRIRQWELSLRTWRWLTGGALVLAVVALLGLALGILGLWHWNTTRALQKENQELRRELEKTLALKSELQRVEHLRRRILYLMGALTDTTVSAVLQRMAQEMGDEQTLPRGWPVRGWITRRFSDLHPGIDIACPVGTPVYATAPGIVAFAGTDSLYGKLVVLRHPGGYETLYGHLSRILVVPGWRVQRGDLIGFSGNTGISTGPHLHYALRRQGSPVDPSAFLGDTAKP